MRMLWQLVVLCALAGCGIERVTYTPEEDCSIPGDEDGNGKADCDDPACAALAACQPMCGNRKLEAGEDCDDGNRTDGDGCDSNCKRTGCGNGIKSGGEECDDGNLLDGDTCDSNCTLPACGNGIRDAGEDCDDGNQIDGDACENDCTLPACGNGIRDQGEECDDGNQTDGDTCENNCTLPRCGNGIRDVGEACDDGNGQDGDDCESDCTLPVCGNGIADQGEQCDDGNAVDSDGCDTTCVISPIAYVKASNPGVGDEFGVRVALSADGSTMAVGAIFESSGATGVDGDQRDESAPASGAVYVFTRTGTTWSQQAYLKASNTGTVDE